MRSILNKLVKKGQTRTFATGHGKNKVNSVVLTEEGQKKLINFIEEKKDVTYMSKMRHPLAIKQGSKIKEADTIAQFTTKHEDKVDPKDPVFR